MSKTMESQIISKGYTTGFVTSKDGTTIGYRQMGNGAGLILVHGGMMASQNFMKLAEAMSDQFTVYIADRRGRGLSDNDIVDYGLMAESEDMQALVAKTKAQNIFGLSSGALITLQTAIVELTLKRVAVYEPAIPVKGYSQPAWFNSCGAAIQKGNYGKAFISIIKGTADSSVLTFLPGFITGPLMNFAIKAADKKITGDDVPLKKLIAAMPYDIQVVKESGAILEKSRSLKAELLLIGGSKSQPFLKAALDELSAVLPDAKRIELKGLGHIAAHDSGSPEIVAKALKSFFAEKPTDYILPN